MRTYDSEWAADFERGPEEWMQDLIDAQLALGPYGGMRPVGGVMGSSALHGLALDLARADVDPYPPRAVLRCAPETACLRSGGGGYLRAVRALVGRLGYRVVIHSRGGQDGRPWATFFLLDEEVGDE